MDLTMSIASLSVGLTQAKTEQSLQLSVMKDAMNMAGQGVEELLASAETVSFDPNLGTMVDVQA